MNRRSLALGMLACVSSSPAVAQQKAAAPSVHITFAKEAVGKEPKQFLPMVGSWVVTQEAGRKVLFIDGREWKRGQPAGPTSDQEIEDFIYDALDLLPATNDVEIRCDGGRATLAGTVSQKRLKRDIGEIAWAIPAINDVHNTITIAPRRRARASSREAEPPAAAGRKPA